MTNDNRAHLSRWSRINSRIDELAAGVGDANRPFVLEQVEQRRNAQHRPGSVYAWTRTVVMFDAHVAGKPLIAAETREYTSFLATLRDELAPRSLVLVSTHLKTAWRDLNNRDDLPRNFRKAMQISIPKDAPAGELVRDDEFRLLLEEANRLTGGAFGVPRSTTWVALLWVLWDAGLRIGEALGLLVSDVEFLPDGRTLLHLRADGRELKTGPRVVPVFEATPALRALLSVHPHHMGASSPLFLASRQRTASGRMHYKTVNTQLTKMANETGINERRTWLNNLTPHDFRHTCATRKARLGWQEDQMRKFFGWFQGSKMASYYVRLNYDDIARRVAQDVGIEAGLPGPRAMEDVQAMVRRLVAEELARR